MRLFKQIGNAVMFLVLADLFILSMSLSQIAIEDRSGYWSPFWRVQADVLLSLRK